MQGWHWIEEEGVTCQVHGALDGSQLYASSNDDEWPVYGQVSCVLIRCDKGLVVDFPVARWRQSTHSLDPLWDIRPVAVFFFSKAWVTRHVEVS